MIHDVFSGFNWRSACDPQDPGRKSALSRLLEIVPSPTGAGRGEISCWGSSGGKNGVTALRCPLGSHLRAPALVRVLRVLCRALTLGLETERPGGWPPSSPSFGACRYIPKGLGPGVSQAPKCQVRICSCLGTSWGSQPGSGQEVTDSGSLGRSCLSLRLLLSSRS